MNSKEIWKDIEDFKGCYQVSNLGNIKSLARNRKHPIPNLRKLNERILKNQLGKTKYYTVVLFKGDNSKGITKLIHRLIAEGFIPKVKGKPFVNHRDGNKINNKISNLEWCTHKENMRHSVLNKLTTNIGESHVFSKLTKVDVLNIRELLKSKVTQITIAKRYGVTQSAIHKIKKGITWRSV